VQAIIFTINKIFAVIATFCYHISHPCFISCFHSVLLYYHSSIEADSLLAALLIDGSTGISSIPLHSGTCSLLISHLFVDSTHRRVKSYFELHQSFRWREGIISMELWPRIFDQVLPVLKLACLCTESIKGSNLRKIKFRGNISLKNFQWKGLEN